MSNFGDLGLNITLILVQNCGSFCRVIIGLLAERNPEKGINFRMGHNNLCCRKASTLCRRRLIVRK